MQNGERELQRQRKREIEWKKEWDGENKTWRENNIISEAYHGNNNNNNNNNNRNIGSHFFLTLMSDYIWQGCEPYRRSGTNWSDDGERPLTLEVIHSNLKRPTPVLHPPISSFLFSFRRVASSKASSKALHITGTMPVPVRGRGIWITAWIGSAEERLSDYRLARSMA